MRLLNERLGLWTDELVQACALDTGSDLLAGGHKAQGIQRHSSAPDR